MELLWLTTQFLLFWKCSIFFLQRSTQDKASSISSFTICKFRCDSISRIKGKKQSMSIKATHPLNRDEQKYEFFGLQNIRYSIQQDKISTYRFVIWSYFWWQKWFCQACLVLLGVKKPKMGYPKIFLRNKKFLNPPKFGFDGYLGQKLAALQGFSGQNFNMQI